MKRLPIAVLAVLAAGAGTSTRVEICHFPPGNRDNYHTLTIPEVALKAHLAHGDLEGSCGSLCGLICSTNDKCVQDQGAFDPSTGRCICSSAPVDCSAAGACLENTGCDPSTGCLYTHDFLAVGGTCSGSAPAEQPCAYDKDCPTGQTCDWAQPAERFIDNGNGTVTDQRTCLMWEKKTSDATPRSLDCHFSWTAPSTPGDFYCGLVADFLQAINAVDGTGLGGFDDWCLPSSAGDLGVPAPGYATGSDPELESIWDPNGRPCRPEFPLPLCYIDPVFGYAQPGGYWSSSALPADPSLVYVVSFDSQYGPFLGSRDGQAFARAVRSRHCP